MHSAPTVSVVIPVKDGERYLAEVLSALARQTVAHDVLVVDSGSRDASVSIARAAGARVLTIASEQFGHGRTRNLGVERTSGEVICFLTQDATPVDRWLLNLLEALELDERVGAAYGPHLPRPDTPPMVARHLTEFFRAFSPTGEPSVQGPGSTPYLSNSNAAYRRACLETIRFRDLPYAEDQAFGCDLLAAGWLKAYHPDAAVHHAHDYGTINFMRRNFDDYRGLRETTGWIEPFALRAAAGGVRRLVIADWDWMRDKGWSTPRRMVWAGRTLIYHIGSKISAALGSRAEHLPRRLRQCLSLESRSD